MAYGTFAFGKKAGMLTPDSVNSLKNAISGLNAEQAALALSTRGLTTAQQNQVLVEAGLVASSDRISASFVKQALLTDGLDKEQQESILIKAGLMHEDSKLLLSGEAVSAQRLKQILIENGYQEEQAETLINSILQEGQNYKEALSWKVLGTKAKEAAIAMLHNPLTWIVATIASVGLLVKGYDALIGKQEKLSRQKIEGLDEDISKLDEEIKTLEELQSKLEDAKGSRYELSQIQTELNDAIGETKGLLNGESKAWDVANAKLKANIELKKQQRKQAQQDRVDESKDLYDSNSMEIDWRVDLSGDKAREYAEALSWMNGKSFDEFYGSDEYNKLTNQQQSLLWEAVGFKNSYTEEWSNYWKEQIDTAYDVFEETISNYDGTGGQDFIKGLISDMVQDGASLSEISDVVTQVINNQDMQDAINKYWESLVNPDIDSEEALQAVKKIFDDIVAKNPALKDFFDNFYNGIVAGGKAATDTSSEVNKMTDSWQSLSDALKDVESAYELFNEVQKDFNSTGAISSENIQKILSKFPDLEDELYEYIMGMRTGASVMDLLKTKSDDMATMSAEAFRRMYLSSNSISKDMKKQFGDTFEAVGLGWDNTQSVMANVNSQIVDANGNVTSTFSTQWANACANAGASVSAFAQGLSTLFSGGIDNIEVKNGVLYSKAADGGTANLVNTSAHKILNDLNEKGQNSEYWDTYGSLVSFGSDGKVTQTSRDSVWSAVNKSYWGQYNANVKNQEEFERKQKEFEERMKQLGTSTDSSSSGKDSTPSYEDPTDAIINRINLRSKEIEQQEEQIEKAIEIAELEKDYKKQISLTNDKLDLQRQRLDELKTANDGLHNEAEWLRSTNLFYDKDGNLIDTNTWFNSLGQETKAYKAFYNSQTSKEEQERIKNFFENVSKYKEAYMNNTEEIVGLNKEILQGEKEIIDLREEYVNDFLDELQEKLDESFDIRISRLNSRSSLLSSHFDIVNAITEEQHNLNKELLEAETIGARMNEQERDTLFTKQEHTRLSGKLNDIMLDVNALQSDYQRDLETATKDTIEEITNNYERQYELKMKEYEIVRAELDLMRKRQILENVENEKSVRTWNGSSWIYEANLQDVLDAQEEVENAKYELARAQAEEAQQVALNAIDANADALETEKNKLTSVIEDMAEKMDGSGKDITSMLKTIAETDLPTFDAIIQSMGESIKEALNLSDDDINAFRTSSNFTINPLAEMKKNSSSWHTVTTQDEKDALVGANKFWADMLGLDYEESTGRWKKKDGTYAYASGTKNAKRGVGLFDEKGFGSEVVLTNDGILTQFNGGERVFSPEMADRLWEMAQKNNILTPSIRQPDLSNVTTIEERINNAINNAITNNAFGDTYYNTIKDVRVDDSNNAVRGFMNYLKKIV